MDSEDKYFNENDQLIYEALLNPVSECFISFLSSTDNSLPRVIFTAYEYEGSNTLIVKESCVCG